MDSSSCISKIHKQENGFFLATIVLRGDMGDSTLHRQEYGSREEAMKRVMGVTNYLAKTSTVEVEKVAVDTKMPPHILDRFIRQQIVDDPE
jgi:hypothetical protein